MKSATKILLALLFAPFLRAVAEPPPEPLREFRGAWVATVYNIDWPSKSTLSAEQQKAELQAIVNRAAELKLNALIFQVRPQCDAFYASKTEPWSQFLTGTMGNNPGYDPLAEVISMAHARGIELHAWVNPFRALSNANTAASSDHVSRKHPEWTRRYGSQLWLDPGDEGARAHSLAVIMDIVKRYDVDGIHIDDYFYPYPVKGAQFPDDATFSRYQAGGGMLARDDWRRANIDGFVEQLYRNIKTQKKWVKFGISPFGIWRPGIPETTMASLDSYAHIFADSRHWLREGWCDYFTPQLYWSIEPAKQSFPVLLKWWRSENQVHRHIWPGMADDRIGKDRKAQEIANQIALAREGSGSHGHVHWSFKCIQRNQGGIADLLRGGAYNEPALVPASPWLGAAPAAPRVEKAGDRISWKAGDATPVRWWLVQWKTADGWSQRLVSGTETGFSVPPSDALAVRALDRAGNASEAAILTK